MRRERVPEGMHGHPPMDAKLGGRPVDSATDGVGAQLLVGLLTRKQKLTARSFNTPVFAQSLEQALGQWDQARTIAFAMPDVNEPGLAVDVASFECEDFGDAQSRTVSGHHDHAVLERLDFAEQGLDLVAANHGGQILSYPRPGNVLHLGWTLERDRIEEAKTSDIHLDGGGAVASSVVQKQELPDFLASHLGRRAHELPRESLRAPKIALLRACRVSTELEIGCHLLVQLTHVSSPCGAGVRPS